MATSKEQQINRPGTFQPGQSGNPKGRKRGSKNKTTMQAKEMVLEALHEGGGIDYLVEVMHSDPASFLRLLARLIPQEQGEQSDGGGGFTIILNGALTDSDEGVNP